MHDRAEASGLQIAFLTLAINLMSIPVARWIVDGLDAPWAGNTMPRLLTLLSGAALIGAFPAARRRALSYLRQPIEGAGHKEVVVVAAANLLVPFAVIGAAVMWDVAVHGVGAFEMDAGSEKSAEEQLSRSLSKGGLLFLFAALVVAPLVEEMIFRGFLFDAWQRRWGWAISALLTSTVFGLYHHIFLDAFIGSLVFICVLRRTGSLRAPIIVHAFGNLVLWYPLLGRFVFPHLVPGENALHIWVPHMIALAACVVLLPAYFFLASTKPATKS